MTATTPQTVISKKEDAGAARTLKIFMSYGAPDHYIAPLLKDLLEAHGHAVHLASEHISAGAPFSEDVRTYLKSSDALVVLVSPNAVNSKWIPRELSVFETTNEDGTVIPLVLEETDVDRICPELSRYPAVSLRPCMRDGIRTLFEALGSEFLALNELRNRRSGGDRRTGTGSASVADRRTGPIRTRLHVGFQVTYTREAGGDVCSTTDLSPESVTQLVAALEPEAVRYDFRDVAGRSVPATEALTAAMPAVCKAFEISSPPTVIAVCGVLADALTSMFDVSTVDRREGQRRA